MANFEFDLRGLPDSLGTTEKREFYKRTVKNELVNNYEVGAGDEITVAAVLGILLLGEYFESNSPSFNGAIRTAREELLNKVPSVPLETLYQSSTSVEIVSDGLGRFSANEVKETLKKVPLDKKVDAITKTAKAKVIGMLNNLTRNQIDNIISNLSDAAIVKKLKALSKVDVIKELSNVSDVMLDEALNKISDSEANEIFDKASRIEIDTVMEKMSPDSLKEMVKNLASTVGNEVSAKDVYKKIAELIKTVSGKDDVFYQEFASVGRYVISRAEEIPFGHPRFERQVKIALDQYVSGAPTFDSLDLPPLSGDNGGDTEIVADNIKAVSMVYAAYQLDIGMRMIDVVDRINEIFHNGQLPIGFDSAGKAIDDYNWSAEDRWNAIGRRTHYSRILGVAGGDVSKEVQPNTQFDSLFIRFLSSLAEYDRQQRVADIVSSARPRNLTSEYVRKSGRDLASNLSLYGWAATQFAARRLRQHVESALNILKQPSVQKAYGVTNLYQVIERVASNEFNATPNIVKHRTMAEAGKQIIDIVAKYAHVWNKSDGTPLFNETTNREGSRSDISDADKTTLLVQTQYWLAVNGVKDAQVDQYAEPEMSKYAPSIPSFGSFGSGSMPSASGGNTDQMDRIKQMVTSGQMPSLDQLQGMFNGNKMGV